MPAPGEIPNNLLIDLKATSLTGVISAAREHHRDGLRYIEETIREELSNVWQTPAEAINNGVIVSVDKKSSWTVTGTCYLTGLHLAAGGQVLADSGTLEMTVDGIPTAIVPGSYRGKIELRKN